MAQQDLRGAIPGQYGRDRVLRGEARQGRTDEAGHGGIWRGTREVSAAPQDSPLCPRGGPPGLYRARLVGLERHRAPEGGGPLQRPGRPGLQGPGGPAGRSHDAPPGRGGPLRRLRGRHPARVGRLLRVPPGPHQLPGPDPRGLLSPGPSRRGRGAHPEGPARGVPRLPRLAPRGTGGIRPGPVPRALRRDCPPGPGLRRALGAGAPGRHGPGPGHGPASPLRQGHPGGRPRPGAGVGIPGLRPGLPAGEAAGDPGSPPRGADRLRLQRPPGRGVRPVRLPPADPRDRLPPLRRPGARSRGPDGGLEPGDPRAATGVPSPAHRPAEPGPPRPPLDPDLRVHAGLRTG